MLLKPIRGESSLLLLFGKKIGNVPLFANYIGACLYFETRLPYNQVMPDQT